MSTILEGFGDIAMRRFAGRSWRSNREEDMSQHSGTHPVDQVPPPRELFVYGLQHVLIMYAGAIAVPIIIGGVLKLPKDQLALLISCDLFACGVVSIIQSAGFWKLGVRLPVMMGVTFAA